MGQPSPPGSTSGRSHVGEGAQTPCAQAPCTGGVCDAGGWGGGDAILSALERAGRRQSLRGRRVTWHSRTLNAEPEPPHQSPSRSRSRYVVSRGFADAPACETGLQPFLFRPLGCEPEPRRPEGAPDPLFGPSQVPPPLWASPSPLFSRASSARSRCAF